MEWSAWASPVEMVVGRPLVPVHSSPSSVLVARLLLVAAKLAMSGGVVREHDLSWALPLYRYVLSLSLCPAEPSKQSHHSTNRWSKHLSSTATLCLHTTDYADPSDGRTITTMVCIMKAVRGAKKISQHRKLPLVGGDRTRP